MGTTFGPNLDNWFQKIILGYQGNQVILSVDQNSGLLVLPVGATFTGNTVITGTTALTGAVTITGATGITGGLTVDTITNVTQITTGIETYAYSPVSSAVPTGYRTNFVTRMYLTGANRIYLQGTSRMFGIR